MEDPHTDVENMEMEQMAPKIVLDEAEIPIYRCFESAVDVDRPKKYIAYQGAQSAVYQKLNATSTANNQVVWQVTTPSVRTGINRQVYVEFTISGDLIGRNGNAANNISAALADRVGVRCLPIHSACDTMSLDLNSSRFSWNPRQTVHALYMCGATKFEKDGYYTMTGSLPDQYSTLNHTEDPANTPFIGGEGANPLRSAYDTQFYNRQTRNLLNYRYKVGAGSRFTITIVEPLMLPPLKSNSRDCPCLYGINNFNLNLIFGDIGRLFSVAQLPEVDDANFNFVRNINIDSAVLHLQYYTFNLAYPLPRTPVWSCEDIINFRTQISSVGTPTYTNTGATFAKPILDSVSVNAVAASQVSNTINLNQIPKAIYIFAKRRVGDDNQATTDTFLRMLKVSVDFNMRSGLLSTAKEEDLYYISRKNGYKASWAQCQHQGMVLCLNPAEDLSLGDDQAPGLIGQFNFQISVDFGYPYSYPHDVVPTNNRRSPITNNWDLEIVCVNEGCCWLGPDGILKTKFGVLTENAILDAPIEYGNYGNYTAEGLYGGSFFGKLKSFVSKAAQHVKKYAPAVAKGLHAASAELGDTRLGKALKTAGDVAGYAGKAANMGGQRTVSRAALQKRLKGL